MMRKFAYILLCVACAFGARAAGTQITARLDSAALLMGKTTALHIEITQDANAHGVLLSEAADTLSAMIEIAGRPAGDTLDLGNGRVQINRDLILQSFDSGLYVIPPLVYVTGTDTVKSEPLSLKVMPIPVDTEKDIMDYKPIEEEDFKVLDWIPDWLADYWWVWLLLLLAIAGSLYYYLKYYRKGRKINWKPAKKRLPPYEEAMLNLQALHEQQLPSQGREQEYFTGLTDILRVYIDRRFDINAVEMTSSQIIDTLRKNEETKAVNEQLSMILEVADLVKFANAKPLADDNEQAYRRAVDFVEATKPLPTEPAQPS